jgi:hypothetical protein
MQTSCGSCTAPRSRADAAAAASCSLPKASHAQQGMTLCERGSTTSLRSRAHTNTHTHTRRERRASEHEGMQNCARTHALQHAPGRMRECCQQHVGLAATARLLGALHNQCALAGGNPHRSRGGIDVVVVVAALKHVCSLCAMHTRRSMSSLRCITSNSSASAAPHDRLRARRLRMRREMLRKTAIVVV